jgi:hypothetical protein
MIDETKPLYLHVCILIRVFDKVPSKNFGKFHPNGVLEPQFKNHCFRL